MGFMVQLDCPCCRNHLWHCKKCWDRYHNGKKHKDYIPPKYYGQSMMTKEVIQKYEELTGRKVVLSFKPDKNRPYREGEYH